jgi:CheY-like chemotaxis protein
MKESKTIYYLDIDNENLYLFKDIVKSLGHNFLVFRDGYKMIYDLGDAKVLPDFIFMATHMPILNDEELIDILKKNKKWKNIPVIMISGAFPKKMLKHYFAIGVNQIMKRPLPKNYKSEFEKVINLEFTKKSGLALSV